LLSVINDTTTAFVINSKFSNASIAEMLREMAAAYTVLNENGFRIRAYQNAAAAIDNLGANVRDVWSRGSLEDIPGVGKGIAENLDDYFKTGRVKHFEQTKAKLPAGMFSILGLPEIGPKTAFRLAKELNVKNKEDIIRAARKHLIMSLPGFGEESERDILKALESIEEKSQRLLLSHALEISTEYINYLKSSSLVIRADPLGSIRRRVATVGDIDIAVATEKSEEVVKHFIKYPQVRKVISHGEQKATVILKTGEQIDLMTIQPEAYGSLLQHFTGSKGHNIALREYAKGKGLSLSEYGVRVVRVQPLHEKKTEANVGVDLPAGKTGCALPLVEFENEYSFYKYLSLDYIPPELREGRGEIEAAQKHSLPNLIELEDIKGDLHNHTDFIEGDNTLEEMITKAKSLGYSYYAYCDHAPSIENRSYKEVEKIIKERRIYVDQYNKTSKNFHLLLGFEVNITAKGEMAWPDELLSQLDFVIASVHTNHKDSKKVMTARLISAINNPYVSIIGHPSSRLLMDRSSSDIDWPAIFKAAAKRGTILEINAHPVRLDLPDDLVFEARKLGIKFIISSDAHSVEGQDIMEYGVWVARRGWLTAKEVVNTWSYEMLKKYFGRLRP